jgi:hypothetical protein
MTPLKRKVSCTFKRETPLEVQERIYLLLFLLIHIKTRRGRPKTKPPAASRGNRKAKAVETRS